MRGIQHHSPEFYWPGRSTNKFDLGGNLCLKNLEISGEFPTKFLMRASAEGPLLLVSSCLPSPEPRGKLLALC